MPIIDQFGSIRDIRVIRGRIFRRRRSCRYDAQKRCSDRGTRCHLVPPLQGSRSCRERRPETMKICPRITRITRMIEQFGSFRVIRVIRGQIFIVSGHRSSNINESFAVTPER